MAKPKKVVLRSPIRRQTQAELDAFLEEAADILRGNADHSEFRSYVFALLFFKRINDVYLEEIAKIEVKTGDAELAKDPKMHNFVVPDNCLWDEVARKSTDSIGRALNDAMIAIERANQPKFDGILRTGIDFNSPEQLPRDKLIKLINHFGSQNFDHAHVSDDLFGNAYEYLIRSFASKAGKSSGEFYTPKEVAYLMAEIIDPQPGHSICDWAAGSGGLLLQCRNYLKRNGKDPNHLFLNAQEANLHTYNISRINMILHGINSWKHKNGDSIRNPQLLDESNRLLKFDRIIMNPPFSLEDWGYSDLKGGDPHHRFDFGMPPQNNGDYAWLQQVVKTMNNSGKAIIVMSQGVLFRGQPEQTEEADGRTQKADDEFVIRKGFIDADLIECIIVLPSKLFYGNQVPGCLIVLNKAKPKERKGRILMIWASRNFQKSNPQNILRPSDLMRILVPWRAFGNLEKAKTLVTTHETKLLKEEEEERHRRLQDIEDAYAPVIEPLEQLRKDIVLLESQNWKKAGFEKKGELTNKAKELRRQIKELEKYQVERDAAEANVNEIADSELAHIREAAADLLRICSDPEEAARFFSAAEREEIEENEYNLNLPRYVYTFEPEEVIPFDDALKEFQSSGAETDSMKQNLFQLLNMLLEAQK